MLTGNPVTCSRGAVLDKLNFSNVHCYRACQTYAAVEHLYLLARNPGGCGGMSLVKELALMMDTLAPLSMHTWTAR